LIDDFANCLDYFSSVRDWWDFFKAFLQSEIIAFSKEKHWLLNFERKILSVNKPFYN